MKRTNFSANRGFSLSEFLIALTILALGILLGLFLSLKPYQQITFKKLLEENSQNENEKSNWVKTDGLVEDVDLVSLKGIPSGTDIIQAVAKSPIKNESTRNPKPWEAPIQSILKSPRNSGQKIASLFLLSESLPEDGKAFAFACIVSLAQASDFTQQLIPKIWNPNTTKSQAYVLSFSLLKQPDGVKLPYAIQLLQHPNDEVAFLAYSILWSYFPNEPDTNYASAVQRFLANPRTPR